MQFVTYEQNNKQYVGLFTPGQEYIIPLAAAEKHFFGTTTIPETMLGIINLGDAIIGRIQQIEDKAAADKAFTLIATKAVKLLAPIPRPTKNIFCVGKNYLEHAFEFEKTRDVNVAVPKFPVIFTKPPTSVTGPNSMVKSHADYIAELDYEVELAVIIGKTGFNISKEKAYEYVFGYTIINDVTGRDLQKKHSQWIMGKGPDTFAPMGPCITHKTTITDPQALAIKSTINGELRQNANTKDLIFDIPTLIATISTVMTLEPGDIIATGTPVGVGIGFNPPKFLKAGDVMELEIEGIGVLKNTIE